jgi:hypothetical protein
MAGSRPRLEVFQASPDGLFVKDDLQYLFVAEQAELVGRYNGINSDIVTLRGIRRQFPIASELMERGWSEVCYRSRMLSYGATAVKSFAWGWRADDPLDSRSPNEVAKDMQLVEEAAFPYVGLTSGLAVYRHKPHESYEVAGVTNYRQERNSQEQNVYALTAPDHVGDVMYRAAEDLGPAELDAIDSKSGTTILPADKLSVDDWSLIKALQETLDGHFVERLQQDPVD